MTLGERIKELRVKNNLTQRELADMIGCSTPSTISQFETGAREPSLSTLVRMADVFQTMVVSMLMPVDLGERLGNFTDMYTMRRHIKRKKKRIAN